MYKKLVKLRAILNLDLTIMLLHADCEDSRHMTTAEDIASKLL